MNWLAWALLSAVFAALTAVFAKIGLKGVNSDFATLVRTFVIAVALGIFVWLSKEWSNPLRLPSRTLGFLIASGLATGLSWMCYFRALQAGEASQVAPVDKLSVVLVAIFAYLFLGERPSAGQWLGIALIGTGALILAVEK